MLGTEGEQEVGAGRRGAGGRFLPFHWNVCFRPSQEEIARHHTHKESLHLAEGCSQLSEHVGLTDAEVGAVIPIPGVLASAGPHCSQYEHTAQQC